MEKRIYTEEQFHTSRWTGGTTTEFAIYPQTAKYLDRNFVWRLSSAQVELEESTFTKLPDYDRVLMVLEGEAVLAHGEERTVSLKELEQDSFDGGTRTRSFGKIRDYNLMVRKGGKGRLTALTAERDAKAVSISSGASKEDAAPTGDIAYSHGSYGFYCLSGYGVVSIGGEPHMVREGQQLILDFDQQELQRLQESQSLLLMGEGQLILAEIFYNKASMVSEEIPEEKATFADFKAAFKLVHSGYKWSQALGKKKDVWYDEVLQKKIRKLDKTYITFILWILVMVIIVAVGMKTLPDEAVIGAVLGWTLVHIFIVSPLIYMAALPKPINAHIKRIDQLNEYEKQLFEQQQGENQIVDKVMKKYKNN